MISKIYGGMFFDFNISPLFSDKEIQSAVDFLVNELGFDNCNGWLTGISEDCKGDVEAILSRMEEDPVYRQHQKEATPCPPSPDYRNDATGWF